MANSTGNYFPFSIGEQSQDIVIIIDGKQYRFDGLDSFKMSQNVTTVTAAPLANKGVKEAKIPRNWHGTFRLLRQDAQGEQLAQALQDAFWYSGMILYGEIHQYIKENDGSVTHRTFKEISISMDEGAWEENSLVRQTFTWSASIMRVEKNN